MRCFNTSRFGGEAVLSQRLECYSNLQAQHTLKAIPLQTCVQEARQVYITYYSHYLNPTNIQNNRHKPLKVSHRGNFVTYFWGSGNRHDRIPGP